jgi:hypothetical protein
MQAFLVVVLAVSLITLAALYRDVDASSTRAGRLWRYVIGLAGTAVGVTAGVLLHVAFGIALIPLATVLLMMATTGWLARRVLLSQPWL